MLTLERSLAEQQTSALSSSSIAAPVSAIMPKLQILPPSVPVQFYVAVCGSRPWRRDRSGCCTSSRKCS